MTGTIQTPKLCKKPLPPFIVPRDSALRRGTPPESKKPFIHRLNLYRPVFLSRLASRTRRIKLAANINKFTT